MPTYDVSCPNCGTYERTATVDARRDPCTRCGSPVELLVTSSLTHHPFRTYFDISLGREVTSNEDRNRAARRLNAEMRPSLSRGDISAFQDKQRERVRRGSH